MAEDPEERKEDRETKTSSLTNPETKHQLTAARSDLAPSPQGNARLIHQQRPHQQSEDQRPPSDERQPCPQECRTRPPANWLYKNSSQVDIVDLHSCPDDDHSMVIETIGIINFHYWKIMSGLV